MPRLTGGQALVESLKREGVRAIFGLPGLQLDWAFDALYDERDTIRVIHTRHEQAAGYMADGYARSTGRDGTFMVVPGPGLLNATAALSTAFACNSRVFCLTGQIHSSLIDARRGVLHEIDDQLGLMRHVTKWAARGLTPAEIPTVVHQAFWHMRSGRPRPVGVEIPLDVLESSDEIELGQPIRVQRPTGDPDLLEAAARALGESRNPLILAGGGVLASGAWDELRMLAEMLEAPVVMSPNGRGALSDRHYLAQHQLSLPELLPKADAVLAVGTRMVHYANQPIDVGDGRPFIRIDADPDQIDRAARPTIGIVGDANASLAALGDRVAAHNRQRRSRRDDLTSLKAQLRQIIDGPEPQAAFGQVLRAELPDDAVVVSDMTQVGYWCNHGFPVYRPLTYLNSGYQGTLGFAYPTSLGAKVGNPDRVVVSINGDGGFMYNVQELATAAQHGIAAIAIVFNDGAFGNVKRIQEQSFGGRTIASELTNPSFAKLAETFGVRGVRAEGPEGLRIALREAIAAGGPALIEVPVGPLPMFLRRVREHLTRQITAAR